MCVCVFPITSSQNETLNTAPFGSVHCKTSVAVEMRERKGSVIAIKLVLYILQVKMIVFPGEDVLCKDVKIYILLCVKMFRLSLLVQILWTGVE